VSSAFSHPDRPPDLSLYLDTLVADLKTPQAMEMCGVGSIEIRLSNNQGLLDTGGTNG